jgi:hypothetical protein
LDAGTETNINLNHQIYYHVMGSDQSEDILCWKDPEHPKYSFGASVTEDGKVLCSHPFHSYKGVPIFFSNGEKLRMINLNHDRRFFKVFLVS